MAPNREVNLTTELNTVFPAEVFPVGGGVDDGGRHEGERRHLDGAQEGHEQVQPRHRGGKSDWK